MAVEKLHIAPFLELATGHLLVDVRSPGEYRHAHIPGAVNIPLFTDEERKIVGTAYKQESREKAIKLGLGFFGPNMRKIVDEVERLIQNSDYASDNILKAPHSRLPTPGSEFPTPNSRLQPPDSRILLYCWRGGMRSAAIAWLLDLYGFKVYTLTGGYKKFRNHVLDIFNEPHELRMIGGFTGSGKTEILQVLKERGEAVIDLENIAKHKGSAFGNIGMPEQPTQEMFENLLAMELKAKSVSKDLPPRRNPIWLEDESQRIGLVNIPNAFWKTMRSSPVSFLDIPFEERLAHIVQEYGGLDKERMLGAIGRIREKLGGQHAKTASQYLEEGNIIESFRILLKYYDKFYLRGLHNREDLNALLHTIECKSVTPENARFLATKIQYQPEKP